MEHLKNRHYKCIREQYVGWKYVGRKKCIKNRAYILFSKSTSKDAIQHLELKSIT